MSRYNCRDNSVGISWDGGFTSMYYWRVSESNLFQHLQSALARLTVMLEVLLIFTSLYPTSGSNCVCVWCSIYLYVINLYIYHIDFLLNTYLLTCWNFWWHHFNVLNGNDVKEKQLTKFLTFWLFTSLVSWQKQEQWFGQWQQQKFSSTISRHGWNWWNSKHVRIQK